MTVATNSRLTISMQSIAHSQYVTNFAHALNSAAANRRTLLKDRIEGYAEYTAGEADIRRHLQCQLPSGRGRSCQHKTRKRWAAAASEGHSMLA